MTKKKKIIYGIVVGFGLLALLVDRMMVTRPQSVSARAATLPSTPNSAIQVSPNGASPIELVAAAPFPQFSVQDLPARSLRDAFTITPAAVQAMGGANPAGGAGLNGPSNDSSNHSAAQFGARHKLSAVLEAGGFGVAVVDGQLIEMGDALDACELIAITGRQAVFECHDGAATLEVASSIDESYAP